MRNERKKTQAELLNAEIGTMRKVGPGRISVALVYPNSYHVGMSNLGFQVVYRLLNRIDEVVCERAFAPDNKAFRANGIASFESGKPLREFDVIAFSISFENDYPTVLRTLETAGLPLQSQDRQIQHPLVIAGGVTCFLNPEPLSPFIDCFLIGEAEAMLEDFCSHLLAGGFTEGGDRWSILATCARRVPGVYVPRFYSPVHNNEGLLTAMKPLEDVPEKITRTYVKNVSTVPTCSTVVTPHTAFDHTFLIEVSRGCPHGCRFCTAGFIYRPPRFRPLSLLQACIKDGAAITNRIGLAGAAVSDLPEIRELCKHALKENTRISFSSLRADALDEDLLAVLDHSRVKTATIAPDAGSERMRRVINKGIEEETILKAATLLVSKGIPNLKLYFMVGLPTETGDDVEAIVILCKKIKHVFLRESRGKGRMGDITVSLNSFVPKPVTPFQWAAMDDIATLKKKIRHVKNGLKKIPNIRVHADVPRWAYIQALFSRGDRRVADHLLLANQNDQNWPQTLKESPINADFYVLRERSFSEFFPWDLIDHGINKAFLFREYEKALNARTSPPCPMTDCQLCGICTPNTDA
jgi:radical SAM family uncharacterized protein